MRHELSLHAFMLLTLVAVRISRIPKQIRTKVDRKAYKAKTTRNKLLAWFSSATPRTINTQSGLASRRLSAFESMTQI